MLPCIQWLHNALAPWTGHITHTLNMHTHANTLARGKMLTLRMDVALVQLCQMTWKRCSSLNQDCFSYRSVFQSGLCGVADTPTVACPITCVHSVRLNRNLHLTTASHTFTIAFANLKQVGGKRFEIINALLQKIHYEQVSLPNTYTNMHLWWSGVASKHRYPRLKHSYYFSPNCTRCPAYHPPGSRATSSNAGLPLLMNTTTTSTK